MSFKTACRDATFNIQRDGSFEIMKYFLVLLCGVQLHVGDVGEAGGVKREVRKDDGDRRVAAKSNLQFMLFYIVTPLFYLNWLRSGSAPAARISTSAWLLLAPSSLSSFSGLFTWVFSCLLSW